MALTIVQDFDDYSPAYNPVTAVVDSDNVGMDGFRYLAEVTVEGETAKTFYRDPDPDHNFGCFDLHNYLETFVKPEIGDFSSTTCFEFSTDTLKMFSVLYMEEWLVSGFPVIGQDDLQGDDKYVWEGSFRRRDFIDQKLQASPYNTWLLNSTNGTSAEFLTAHKTTRTRLNDLGWSWFMTDTPTDCKKLRVITYDEDGSVIGTFRINNLLSTASNESRLQRVTTHPESLNAVAGASFDLGAQPVITDSVASYTCQILTSANAVVSEILTFEIEEDCRYEVIRLHFENELGGYDAFNFKLRNQRSSTHDRSTYMSDPWNLTETGISWKHEHIQSLTHYVKATNKIKIRSEYLSNDEIELMRVLLKSTSIYLEFTDLDGNKNLEPVKEISGDWTEKTTSVDKLFIFEADITMSWADYSQRK